MRFDNIRVAPAFADGSGCSRFSAEYAKGAFPCRIDHGTCHHRIAWDVSVDEVARRRDDLIALCADGLREVQHPYATVARLAFAELADLGSSLVSPLLDETVRRVMASVRLALSQAESSVGATSSRAAGANGVLPRTTGVFDCALAALRQFARVEGARLVPHMHMVLPPIGKQIFSKVHREAIQETLRDLATYGGPEAEKAMVARGVVAGMR